MNSTTRHENPKAKFWKFVLWGVLIVFLVLAALFLMYVIKVSTTPVIEVQMPGDGDSISQFEQITIQAVATRRGIPVHQLDLYIDGILSGSIMGESDSLAGTWRWIPRFEGSHIMTFVATNKNGVMNTLRIRVEVLPVADTDGDGLPDSRDSCAEVFGYAVSGGCPIEGDTDYDGLIGSADACPDAPGPESFMGCPIQSMADSDMDGIPDNADLCPGEAGMSELQGCSMTSWLADRDGDLTPDFLDLCPDTPGIRSEYGCLLISNEDRDGDGVADLADVCIDEPGSVGSSGCPVSGDRDGDGIADDMDRCPDEPGLEVEFGCLGDSWMTDSDGDGVIDIFDLSPTLSGAVELAGLPYLNDADSDGILDADDNCPSMPGSAADYGCPKLLLPADEIAMQNTFFPVSSPPASEGTGGPVTGVIVESFPNDRDGDGVEDSLDLCPDVAGEPSANGCIPENDRDRDGIPDEIDRCDDVPGLYWDEYTGTYQLGCPRETPGTVSVELEVTAIRIPEEMQGVYCYVLPSSVSSAILADRIPTEYHMYSVYPVSGYGYYLRLSEFWPRRTSSFYETSVISLYVACWGQPEGISIPARYLGEIYRIHAVEDWDSQIRYAAGTGDGIMFEVYYRLCRGSCPH